MLSFSHSLAQPHAQPKPGPAEDRRSLRNVKQTQLIKIRVENRSRRYGFDALFNQEIHPNLILFH